MASILYGLLISSFHFSHWSFGGSHAIRHPFIGTEGQGYPGTAINSGNVFPGAALPFGVIKFGIDTTAFDWTNVDADAGYTPDGYCMIDSSLPGFQAKAGSHWSEYVAREWNRGKSSLLHRII